MLTNYMQRGFTLIELMVSVTIFVIVMVVSLGSLLSISAAERKAEALKTVMNNLNFGLESMSRSIRTGYNYHCDSTGTLSSPKNCDNASAGGTYFAFEAINGNSNSSSDQVVYRLETTASTCGTSHVGGCIMRSTNGGSTFVTITAPEVAVSSLNFYVVGAYPFPSGGVSSCGSPPANTDCIQARVVLTLAGSITLGASAPTDFKLQTSVAERIYDQ